MVEKADVAMFRTLAGPRRVVVDEREVLPRWLAVVPDPLALGRRRVRLASMGFPLRGWHVQQMRKIAMASILDEDGALFCDSDTVFVREGDLAELWTGDRFAFYWQENAIQPSMAGHVAWSARAARLLGIDPLARSYADYISQAVGWCMDTIREMVARIEKVTGRGWAAALAADRIFSEYQINGRFVDEVEGRPDRHVPSGTPICHSRWSGTAMDARSLAAFVQDADPRQPAIGIQSSSGPTFPSSGAPPAWHETATRVEAVGGAEATRPARCLGDVGARA